MASVLLALKGKHAFVTGASGVIGAAIARRLAAEGATVSLAGRNGNRLAEALSALPAGQGHRSFQADVAQYGEINEAINRSAAEAGRLDILVNAAGISFGSLLVKGDPERAQAVYNTNLLGATYASKASISHLRKTQGSIVNVSSILARKGIRGASVYAASKAGLIGLTHSLVAELSPWSIRVNAVLPGYIDTAMVQAQRENFNRKSPYEP